MAENEHIINALKNVFFTFASCNVTIKDDSYLLKLADFLDTYLIDRKIATECGVLDFLETVTHRLLDCDTNVAVLCLRITGILAARGTLFTQLQPFLTNILIQAHERIMKEWEVTVCPDLAGALYHTYSRLLTFNEGYQWICQRGKDIVSTAWDLLQRDSSFFLTQVVTKCLETLWVVGSVSEDGQNDENWKLFHIERIQSIIGDFTERICRGQTIKCSLLQPALDLIYTCAQSNFPLDRELLKNIIKLLSETEGSVFSTAVKILSLLVAQSCPKADADEFEKILLLPVEFVTGSFEPDKSSDFHVLRTVMSKSSQCSRILCKALSWLVDVKKSAFEQVLKLLKCTYYSGGQLETVPRSIQRVLLNNRKLQQSCVMYFLSCGEMADTITQRAVVHCLIDLVKDTSLDTVTFEKCTAGLQFFFLLVLDDQKSIESLATELATAVQHNLCGIHWETRDSTLEFLRRVLEEKKNQPKVFQWVTDHQLHIHIWQCIHDQESYVRGTAIRTLAVLVSVPFVWDSLIMQAQLTEEDVITKILSVLESDTEAFARRSAAEFIVSLNKDEKMLKLTEILTDNVFSTMNSAIKDFDWEVKLTVLQFWEDILQKQLGLQRSDDPVPPYLPLSTVTRQPDLTKNELQRCFESLWRLGCWDTLMYAVDDYDITVVEKSCQTIQNLINTNGKELRELEENWEEENLIHCAPKARHKLEGANGCSSEKQEWYQMRVTLQTLLKFKASDHKDCLQTTDMYDKNPLDLLQDILLSCTSTEEEENTIDCY
ncbi:hypothetical protein ACJMK2_034902 [Sinanodonta woodiana]|uniref:BRCA1-associated ATM activator 1 n=1 Tax=Sinanodonta woodiana TaxID=1069815 RepID=A0ABD3WT88_SINWO